MKGAEGGGVEGAEGMGGWEEPEGQRWRDERGRGVGMRGAEG